MALTFRSVLNGFAGGCRANTLAAGATRYVSPLGGIPGTEDAQNTAMPMPGTFKWGQARTGTTQSNTGSLVFTWRKNKVSQSLVVTVAANSGAGNFSDMANSFSYVAGDLVCVLITNNASATSATIIGLSSIAHGDEVSYSHVRAALCATGGSSGIAASTTNYSDFIGSGVSATETAMENLIPANCSIRDLGIRTANTQPVSGALTLTLRVNEADTSEVLTVGAGSGAGYYSAGNRYNGALMGDRISIKNSNAATGTSAQIMGKNVYFYDPKIRPRTSLTCQTGNGTIGSGSTLFVPGANGGSWNASEGQRSATIPVDGVLRNFYVVTTTSQPATGGVTFTYRLNAVNTSIAITVAAGSGAGTYSDTTNTATASLGNQITIRGVNSATSASCTSRFGIFLGE